MIELIGIVSRGRALLDAPNQSSQLRDFIGLAPRVHNEQNQNNQANRQRLQIVGHCTDGVPGDRGEGQARAQRSSRAARQTPRSRRVNWSRSDRAEDDSAETSARGVKSLFISNFCWKASPVGRGTRGSPCMKIMAGNATPFND